MNNKYQSPRWSGEILDCSMPMTFDTYSSCSYNCLYCFSYYQKSHSLGKGGSHKGKHDYRHAEVHGVNVKKVKKYFTDLNNNSNQFRFYIRDRKVMQWGGLSDPFDEYERRYGVTLELLKFFKEINYPLCFSTKGIWWLDDERYLELFKGQDNWNMKISIINLDEGFAKKMEKGVPSPMERIEAIRKYTTLNKGGATLRLRPFIVGFSDRNNEHLKLIKLAKEAGATAVSTEFFCLEARADERLKLRYKEMSEIVGFNIMDYYRRFSKGAGYKRLNYNLKKKYFNEMEKLCKDLGLRFYVSDAHHKEKSHNGSCCGLSEKWNYSRGQFTEAILIAKKKGSVRFKDIEKDIMMFKSFKWNQALGFNSNSSKVRAKRKGQTMYDYIRAIWNTPNSSKSPYKYFSGVLVPEGIDEDNNVIYVFKNKNS